MEPLKNRISRPFLEKVASDFQNVHPAFPAERFLSEVLSPAWDRLELKQRIRHISAALRTVLPPDYRAALAVVVDVAQRLVEEEGEKLNFWYSFLPDFVEAHGVDNPDASLPALAVITRYSSAEFAVRPFLLRYPERMYALMLEWSGSPSPMVRRLSSEGIRPRLPWGAGVPALKQDPSPILPILENLKNDPAETVRKSVANNLNDISKDHPELVLRIAARWLGHHPATDWIVRHACRGLLKKGNATALAHFGYQSGVEGIDISNLTCPTEVTIGGRLDFGFQVRNHSEQSVAVRLEYGINYLTSTGKNAWKVFKIKEMQLLPGQSETISRAQRFTDFTTRKHFAGPHRFSILVNGKVLMEAGFEVVL